MIVETLNSTYELDMENKRVRRVEGKNPPAGYMAVEDGEWMQAQHIVGIGGTPRKPKVFSFHWGNGLATITSLVKKVKRDA